MPVLEEAQEVWGILTVHDWEFTAVRIIRETTARVYYQNPHGPRESFSPKLSFLDVRGPERDIRVLVHRLNSAYGERVQRIKSAVAWWHKRRAEILGEVT